MKYIIIEVSPEAPINLLNKKGVVGEIKTNIVLIKGQEITTPENPDTTWIIQGFECSPDEGNDDIYVLVAPKPICDLCSGTGNQKIGSTKTTVKPCPNGCKNAISQDVQNEKCPICNGTKIVECQECEFCKLIS